MPLMWWCCVCDVDASLPPSLSAYLPLLGFLTMSCLSEISLIFPLRLENSSLGCRSSGTAPSAESARGLVRVLFGLAVPRCSFATSRSLALSLLTYL